jgi:hypothetical protein
MPAEQEMISTKIVRYQNFEDYTNNYKRHYVFHFKNKKTYELVKGELLPFEFSEGKITESSIEWIDADIWGEEKRRQKRVIKWNQDDGTIFTHRYRGDKIQTKYGFSSLSLVRKNGLLGVVDNNGKVILDFKYDEIIFDEYFSRADLYKNGKMGLKIIFTHYPTIAPKYDKLTTYERSLRVTKSWSFSYCKIKLNGQYGYVGENGVEYFDFD